MPTVSLPIVLSPMNAERDYAAKHLMAFLRLVGSVEAVWAMTTALEALMDLPVDHVAAAATALDESMAEFEELAQRPIDKPADGNGKSVLDKSLEAPKPKVAPVAAASAGAKQGKAKEPGA